MPEEHLYAGGLQLNFLETATLESDEGVSPDEAASMWTRNVWRYLMMGWQEQWDPLISRRSLQAVFIRHDPTLISKLGIEFKKGLRYIAEQLQAQQEKAPLTDPQHRQAELYLANCLAYLPYIEPVENEPLAIPRYYDNRWQLVDYRIDVIELTDSSIQDSVFLSARDRVYAFGLRPCSQPMARAILVLPGTTYPAGQGFLSHLDADFDAFYGTGEQLYLGAKQRLLQWAQQCATKPQVLGCSLGGAMALKMAVDMGNILSRVDAINPVGLYMAYPKSSHSDHWEDFKPEEQPKVVVQRQVDDIISTFGEWKKEWLLLQSDTPPGYAGPNGVINHALNLAGSAETRYRTLDPMNDNKQRFWRNVLFYHVLRSAFYCMVIAPVRFFILPVIRGSYLLLTCLAALTSEMLQHVSLMLEQASSALWASIVLHGISVLNTLLRVGRFSLNVLSQLAHQMGQACQTEAEECVPKGATLFQPEDGQSYHNEGNFTSSSSPCAI
ncbi:MAG: hypothetical protein JJT82_10115 [Legionellaceae bacterium]|nr:hypothetical protein [Legionellaceae bacterium]